MALGTERVPFATFFLSLLSLQKMSFGISTWIICPNLVADFAAGWGGGGTLCPLLLLFLGEPRGGSFLVRERGRIEKDGFSGEEGCRERPHSHASNHWNYFNQKRIHQHTSNHWLFGYIQSLADLTSEAVWRLQWPQKTLCWSPIDGSS